MASRLAAVLATWFGAGLCPYAPGTAGALGGLVPVVLAWHYLGWNRYHLLAATLLLLPVSLWSAGRFASDRKQKDPAAVVIDEVIGQWCALLGATALNEKSFVLAFCLFRLFDVTKPFPARRLERLPGGSGIVADDIAAAAWAALVLWLAGCFNLY